MCGYFSPLDQFFQLSRHQLGILQFNYDTDYLELVDTPQVESSTL